MQIALMYVAIRIVKIPASKIIKAHSTTAIVPVVYSSYSLLLSAVTSYDAIEKPLQINFYTKI